ncbi:MAG: ABC transporter substrate-binding protein, partial [Lachnospiraceae bacterium]
LCVGMVASLAVGCGSKDAGGDSSDGGKKLVYWSMWSEEEPQAKVIKEAIATYEKDSDVKVDVQFKGRNGQREGLQPALDAKQNIDLFDEDVNRVNGSWGKYTLNLEDVAKDYESTYGNETLFNIARAAYAVNDGKEELHSIPYQPSIFGFFYNKALFDKAGIAAAPKTWEEFDAACAKLKEAGITPITADDAYMTPLIGVHLARYLGQDGVKSLVMGEKVGEAEVKWDDPRVLKAAESYADFAKKGYFSSKITTNAFPAGQNQEFAPGDAAIVIDGSWVPNEVKEVAPADFDWGYFNYPSVPDGIDDNTANNIANQVFAINKNSKMSKEAMDLITCITTGDMDKKMIDDAVSIPTDKANSDAWPKQLAGAKEGFDSTCIYYDWAAGVENNADLTPTLKENTIKLVGGQIDAAGFVSAMQKAANQ